MLRVGVPRRDQGSVCQDGRRRIGRRLTGATSSILPLFYFCVFAARVHRLPVGRIAGGGWRPRALPPHHAGGTDCVKTKNRLSTNDQECS